ncbi:phosphatase PAP2 family protein [Clostridium akagii]|uniref:phosphatase PAP2 family protein n=1 Tax=Clostridium akagii TaxID=91623 RepID=UPI000479A0E1|nr:phosphatase PAP2 family protein [Clostridium akagii]
MKKILPNIRAMAFMLPILVLNLTYSLIDKYANTDKTLITSLDNSIPFVKQFVMAYVMWFALVPLVFLYVCIKDKETFVRMLVSMVCGLLISYITFFFFQTTVPRPNLVGNDIFTDIIRIIYNTDRPYNCFPSIHVMNCLLMIQGMWVAKNKNTPLAIVITILNVLVILSTLFIKQHVVLDAVFGAAIAIIAFTLTNIFMREKAMNFCRKIYRLTDFNNISEVK